MKLSCWGFLGSLLVFTSSAFSQQLTLGILGGAPITNSVIVNTDGFTFDSAHKGILGASVEVRLPFGLSVEGDALFHPFDLEVGLKPPPAFVAETLYDYKTFEFPVLAKARFTNGLVRPFAEGGPEFRAFLSDLKVAHYGVTFGAGLEIGKKRWFKLSPEIRYTYWGPDSLITVNGSKVPGSQQNQLTALIGISY